MDVYLALASRVPVCKLRQNLQQTDPDMIQTHPIMDPAGPSDVAYCKMPLELRPTTQMDAALSDKARGNGARELAVARPRAQSVRKPYRQ